MQAVRKCVRCNADNNPEQIYCAKCGKFLPKGDRIAKNVTIWDIGDVKDKGFLRADVGLASTKFDVPQKYVVICPQCANMIAVDNGIIPLACDPCGYFFQAGIDKVIPVSLQKASTSDFINKKDDKSSSPDNSSSYTTTRNDTVQKKGPLARVRRDTSSLRLIIISRNGATPENVKESGDIIGANGTILKGIKTTQQISVWHSPAGWYAITLAGSPLYNGVPVNTGMQIKLSDGDILTVEREQVRVEIV